MKEVLISIQPKWCEKIAIGEKTIEVRKSRPKLETPFKVYIYCTYGNAKENYCVGKRGKVIGEFVCDRIDEFHAYELEPSKRFYDIEKARLDLFLKESCLSYNEVCNYRKNLPYFKPLYGWHISNLKIYDNPKELIDFRKPCPYTDGTYCIENKCEYYGDWTGVCRCWVEIPPQSWCYVEVKQ